MVRFGFEWFEGFCTRHGAQLIILNGDSLSPEQELVQDLLSIVHIFSARLYGLRSYKKAIRRSYLGKIYKRVAEKRRNKQKDSLHKASSLIAYKLAESAVVIGDLSQRQMVRKSENKWLNRAVFNDWGLYQFVEMLKYKLLLAGKPFQEISERDTSKTCHRCGHKRDMPLHQRTYKCPNCSLKMDRDENSARNILLRYLARLEPHRLSEVCGVLGSHQEIDTFTHV